MPPTRDNNVVKLAVELQAHDHKPVPFLGEFSLQDPLSDFILVLCNLWKIDHPEHYALQYTEAPKEYVTEMNRNRIKDGIVLHLVYSARKTADDILKKLSKPEKKEKEEALDKLSHLSNDITFANEFIKKQGMLHLLACLQNTTSYESPLLPPILSSCLDLMDHGIMRWDELQSTFIERVASYVTCQGTIDSRTLSTSLTILENIILNSPSNIPFIEKQITVSKLLNHIVNAKKGTETQQAVLALINALIQKSVPHMKKHYCGSVTNRQSRSMIFNNVVLQLGENTSQGSSDLAHQLYVLQQLILNQYEDRMNASMDVTDPLVTDNIRELRKIAFESDGEVPSGITPRRPEYKKEYKKLGFKNDINPAEDFKETPPGMLALDNMVYFARKHSDHYVKLVLENCYRADFHECPFGRASIELTKLLCEILKIGEVPNEQGQSYHAMFFSNDCIFEELFSICIVLLNKTWKEMKATTEDFSKVVSVVKEQIKRSISKQPVTLEEFRKTINNLTYAEIAEIWRQERLTNEEQEMQAPPIKELRKALEPDILELIQQHRLRFLVEGTRFKIARGVRAKDKFRYCRLSPNHKFLHYDDCDEKSVPLLEDLSKKISIVEIKSVVTGKECPHMREKAGKKNPSTLAFSVLKDSAGSEPTSVDFVAPDETTYNYWVDGLNALLRQRMPSPQTTADLEMLLNMEIKLRLLDAEGVTIPQQQPEIPPPPPNFIFHYQLQ
ncbi:engulfment and cell motility protein 2-like [Eriocheir sinensis]|uniref:engulfment and cell motility protein 2-like n=1 Tax=Eriocheir sinensis TaxID=95602 RepID=UPI0021C98A56|nr:engulfment and cell motility protein 2-like [Eriocheir sinensis]